MRSFKYRNNVIFLLCNGRDSCKKYVYVADILKRLKGTDEDSKPKLYPTNLFTQIFCIASTKQIDGRGTVQAFDLHPCSLRSLWEVSRGITVQINTSAHSKHVTSQICLDLEPKNRVSLSRDDVPGDSQSGI